MSQKSELSNIGVYYIYCNSSDKFYIASAINIRKRFNSDKSLLKRKKHCNPRLQSDWDKFGEENFEFGVWEFCNDECRDEIKNKYIAEYKDCIYLIGRNKDTYFMDVPRTAGIYMIENIITGQKYIGGTLNVRKRFREHHRLLRGNSHFNYKFQNNWNKYSREDFKFKLIESCDKKILKEREQHYINFYNSSNIEFGLNISPFSDSTKGVVKTEEQVNEQRELSKLKWKNPEYRNKQIETRKKLFSNPLKKAKMKEISNNMWQDPKKYKSTLEKRSNVTKEQVEKILSLKDSGLTYLQISVQVGCKREIVGRICRGESKFALLE